MMILKNKLYGSAARLGRGFQTRPVKTKMVDINLPCLHKVWFHSRMLVRSKDLSAVECNNDAYIRQAYLILHASFVL